MQIQRTCGGSTSFPGDSCQLGASAGPDVRDLASEFRIFGAFGFGHLRCAEAAQLLVLLMLQTLYS